MTTTALTGRLLFLDFDGVLHPNFCSPDQYFCRLPDLAKLLGSEDRRLRIVISSSWRFHHSPAQLVQVFPEHVRARVVGGTGEPVPGSHSRYNEILAFLGNRRDRDDWRALDDSLVEFPDRCPQLIACDGRRGIGDNELEQLRSWLRS